ncbi:MAG: leukotoxin LktA family filamentous adhesin [Endomicrobia bacterium]|nr:leukotoxin LktA family filamentous adhesin [Endomicrobiia bacterium]
MNKKIISWVVAAAFLCSQTGFAQVVSDKPFTAVTNVDANTQQVTTTLQSGNTGFNSFSRFNVDAGKTVNLIMDGMNNLVNLINDNAASQINGIVNALRNGKIGGNVFFLNPNGIIIGASGIVNVGSLTLAAPSQAFMDSVIDGSNNVDSLAAAAILAGQIPINPSGTISVKGQINAKEGADIYAGEVKIENGGEIRTITAANIANYEGAPTTEVVVKDGRVLIQAKKIEIEDNVLIDASNSLGVSGDITIKAQDIDGSLISTTQASVDIGAAIIKGNDINIEATASNTYDYEDVKGSLNLNFDLSTDSILTGLNFLLDQVSDATDGVLDSSFAKSDAKASITIADGAVIDAENNLSIKALADSQVTVKTEAANLALSTGINLTEASVTAGNALLKAGNDVNIEAKSKVTSEVEAKSESDEQFKGAIAVSVAISETSVKLDNSTIEAGNDASIASIIEEDIQTKAVTEKDDGSGSGDTKISIGLPVNYTDITNDTIIEDGDIQADKNIEIAGKNITIKDSSIKSIGAIKGDVKITASDKGSELISTRSASIEISGSEIEGKDITIEATAENKYTYDDTPAVIEVSDLTDGILGGINEVLELVSNITDNAVAGKIAKSDVSANITISDTTINADNDINITTSVDSQATAKAEAENLALAAGVNIVESKIDISQTDLKAGNDAIVEAKSKITSEVEAKSESEEKYKGAIALSVAIADTSVNFDDSTIEAGNDAAVSVITEKDITTKAVTEKDDGSGSGDTKISVGVSVNYTDLVNEADINGSIKAGNDVKIASEGDNRRSTAANPDVKIKADVEAVQNIDISGKNIKIEDSSIKSTGITKGDITITASDKGAEIISTRKASVDISNTEIEGKDITIEAAAENKYEYDDLSDTVEIRDLTDTALAVTNEVLDLISDLTDDAIKGKMAKSDVSANINISGDTNINADNDLNIKTSVESQTTVKTDAKGLGVAVGVNLSESNINIGKASLTAGNDISINAATKITSEVEAKSTSHDFDGAVELGGAVGAAYIKSETAINISKDADINAGNNITIDAVTEKDTALTVETKAGENANAALAVGINLMDTENTVTVKGKVKAGNDVNINSKIDSKNTKQNISASTGNKEENEEKDKEEGQNSNIKAEGSNLQTKTNDESEKTNDNSGIKKESGSNDDGNTVTLAGAVLYADVKNTSKAEISGADAEVEALNDINMKAETINANIKQFVDAQVAGSQDSTVKGTGAVVIGKYTDDVKAVVDGAAIDAGKKINISSNHEMPFDSSWFDVFVNFKNDPNFDSGKEVFEKLKETKSDGGEGLKESVVNSWVRSSAPEGEAEENNEGGEDKKGGSSFSVTASGSVNITNYDFTSEAYIKNAKVNQKTDPALNTGEQSVNVDAQSKTTSVTVGGIFGDSYKSPLGQGGADVGVGGTYNQIWYNTKTNAYIENNSKVYANDLNVTAAYDQLDVTVGIAGGDSKTFGLQGVFNWVKSDSEVGAFINDSDITVEKGNLAGGKLNIEAKHTPILVNVAGSLSMSEKVAVGASVAVTDIDRITNAAIIDSVINNQQNAKLFALNDGLIHSYAIAAAYAGPKASKDAGNQAENPDASNMANSSSGTSGGSGDSGSFGIGISGSAGIANITGQANAFIKNTKYEGTEKLEIFAKEESDIINATGGVSIAAGDGTGVAIAGAGSISWISNNAKAYAEDSDIDNEGDIILDAVSDAGIVSVAVGLAGSFTSDGAAIAGSGSINITNNKTQAYIKDSTVNSEGNLNINSYDDSDIFALAGAVAVAMGSAGIGGALGVNVLHNNTGSFIESSDIFLKKDIFLNSLNSSDIISLAGSVGVGVNQAGAAVTVNVNVINNGTQSYIKGFKSAPIEARDIFLSAKDNSDIFAIAGAAGFGNSAGIGIGVGFNSLFNSASAYMEDVKIENEGNIEVKASSEGEIQLIIAALGGAGTVGIAGAAGIGIIHNTADAYINNSTIVSEGSIGLLADNKNNIQLYSGSLAIGGTVGVGANVGFHYVGSRSFASILDSDITAKGNNALSSSFGGASGLTVNSNIYDKIFTLSAAGAGSGTVSVSGGITGTVVDGQSVAKITNSQINKDYSAATDGQYGADAGVSVAAENETDVAILAGAVAVSGTVGVSVAADFETMNNKIEAYIDNSNVKAKGDVEVKTKNTEKYAAALVSGAVSGGVSVAGNVIVGVNTSENHAYINKSDITARDVSVEAKDAVIIGETDPVEGKIGIAMGTLAGGAYAGVAGTVFTSVISNSTIAEIISSNITASRNIKLDAEGYQKTFANLATFGGAIAGIAVTAGVSVNNTETFALIRRAAGDTSTYNLSAQNIIVDAKNTLEVDKIFFGGSAGVVGVTAGISVGVYNNNVTAGIGSGINTTVSGNVGVSAQNNRDINDIVVSVAGGGVGINATVDVIVVGGNVDANDVTAEDDENGPSSNTYLKDSKDDIDDNMKMSSRINGSQVGGGGLIDTGKISDFDYDDSGIYGTPRDNGTFAYIDGNVTAGGDVIVKADDNVKINANIGSASSAGISVGASVAVQDLATRTEASIGGKVSANDINITANSDTSNATGIYMGSVGAIGVNAGVAVINSNNLTNSYIANNAEITTARNINVLANAVSNITPKFVNVGIGQFAAVGAVVGVVNKGGGTNAWIGNNTVIGNQNALTPTVNSLTVKAQTGNNIDADMIAAAGSIGLAATVNVFVLNVNDNLSAYTGTGSKLNLYDLNVLTNGKTWVDADFTGVSVGSLSIAASVAFSRINLSNNAYIGANNTVKADNVSVKAYHNVSSDAKAIGGSGGLISANGIVIENMVRGDVISSLRDNSVFQVSGKLSVLSDSYISQIAQGLAVTAGYVALGLVLLDNTSRVNTKAQLGGGLSIFASSDVNGNKTGTDEIEIKSGSTVNLVSQSQSGRVGAFSAGGTSNTTLNNSLTETTIGAAGSSDIYAKNLNIYAKATSNQNSYADSITGGALDVGIINLSNVSNSEVNVDITGQTDITANNIEIRASNIFNKLGSGANIDAISASVAGGFFAKSITDIYNDTKVNFGAQTNITTKKDENKNSTFTVDLYNGSNAADLAKLKTASGASYSTVESTVNNNSNTEANFAGKIYAGKDFTVNALADQDIDTQTYIDAVAFISGVQGNSNSIANINNSINFLNGADIYAAGDLNLNLSRTGVEVANWAFYGSRSITEIYNMAALPINANSQSNSIINVNDNVNVNYGASLKSSKNVNIASSQGRSKETGVLRIYTPAGELATKESDRKIERNVNSLLAVNGSILAGANNDIEITILQDGTVVFGNPEIFVNYKTGTMNIVSEILKQKEALEKLKAEYGASSIITGQIDFEISRLNTQLEVLGFRAADKDGVMVDVSFADVNFIEFGDMAAGRGDIQIEMNNISGNGSLKANSSAEVNISNYSDNFLRINDIMISDEASGDIFVNYIRIENPSEIKDASIGTYQNGQLMKDSNGNVIKTDNSLSVSSNNGDPSSQPVIIIDNQGNPSAPRAPNLELLGDIINPLGKVILTSEGSIESRGTILASTINIDAKLDFVQTALKNEFIFHVGGDPRNVWGGLAGANETNPSHTDTSSDAIQNESSFAASSIIANNIYISGTYLDINGLIQAGVKDWDLNIGDTIYLAFGDGTIADAVRDYLSKNSSTANALYKLSNVHGNLTAYYNVVTGNIEVASVNIEGGKLYLYGNIINTSAQGYGKLVALDGYAKVTITNNSASEIILNNINTDKKINGEIKITDLAKTVNVGGKWVPLETTYTFENGQIRTVTNAGTSSLASTAQYNPASGIRYTWTTGSKDVTEETYYHERNSFWGMDWLVPDKSDMTLEREYTVSDPLSKGEYITYGSSGDPRYIYNYQYRGTSNEIIHDENGSYSTGWWIFSTQTYWRRTTWQTGVNNFNIHSIKADNPINIGFIGYSTPQDINVTSNNTIGLRGAINAGSLADVYITSNNGAIQGLGAGAQVSGQNITLKAAEGIGGPYHPLTVSLKGGVFNAINSSVGNIDLIAKTNNGLFDVFTIGNITAAEGDVTLISNEEITADSSGSKIKGVNTKIESARGAITGYNGAELEIDAENIEANAYGDIKLIKKVSGDLGVSNISSTSGDIYLTVTNGSVYDINTDNDIDERKREELLALWDGILGLFDSNRGEYAWTQDQLLYAMNGAKDNGGQYILYDNNFNGRNVFINAGGSVGLNESSLYVDLSSKGAFANLSESEKLSIATAEYYNIIWDRDEDDNLLGLTILNQKQVNVNATEKLNVNADGYVYIGSQNDINIEQIKSGGNVSVKSAGGIYNASLTDNPNITGNHLMLESGSGDIGALNKKLALDISGVLTAISPQGSMYLSSVKDLSLNYLSAPGSVYIDAKGNVYSAGYEVSDYENIAAHNITINAANVGTSQKALNIIIRAGADEGAVNIEAVENVYLNNVGNSSNFGVIEDLYFGKLTAGEYVSVISKYGGIYGLDENSVITAKNLIMGASNASIGEFDNKVKADVKEVISAFAKGDIYIEAQNKGNFEEISSLEGLVDLSSTGNLYADKISADKDINLTAAGSVTTGMQNITSLNGKITVTGKDSVEINANLFAKDDIELQSEEDDLKVSVLGSINSAEGSVLLSSGGKTEIEGNISADKDITADSENDIMIEGSLTSANGGVALSSEGKTEITGVISADKNITADSGKELIIKGGLTSANGAVGLKSGENTEITGNISANKNITVDSKKDIFAGGSIISVNGGAALSSEGKTEITGNISADKDITVDSQKELTVKGDLTSANGGVDLKSEKKTDIDGAVTAKEAITSLVENGDLTIKGVIRSLDGNINFNVLNGSMIIGNKAVSERGTIFADVYGDIKGDKTNIANAGFYAGEIRLNSQTGDIGKPDNLLRLDNENPDFVKANLIALNGGIYVEGFTYGLIIERFWCAKDLSVISNGDILAVNLGNKEPNIKASNITLHSLTGSIGRENSRIIVEPIKEKGKVNLSAVTGIYLDQYAHNTFYSDYVKNSGKGKVSLLVPNNNAFIVDFSVLPGTDVNIQFVNNKYVKNVSLGYKDIKKLVVDPMAVWFPVFKTASEDRYNILSNENIEDYIEKMQNENLIISSNIE